MRNSCSYHAGRSDAKSMVITSSRGFTSVPGGGSLQGGGMPKFRDRLPLDRSMDMKFKRAIELHRAGDPAQASLLYAEILESEPHHPDALHLLGVTETQLGQAESGLGWIVRSLAVNPHQPVAIANQGNALLALNRAAEALCSYEQALCLMPDYLLAVLGRGNALGVLGRQEEALSSFDRALGLAPDFVPALGGRASALQKLGRYADSLAAYDRAIDLMPRSPRRTSVEASRFAASVSTPRPCSASSEPCNSIQAMPKHS